MKHLLPLFLFSAVLFAGCAGSSTDTRQPEEFILGVRSNPELLEIDTRLDALDEKTAQLSAQYDTLQQGILPHATFESDPSNHADKIEVYINENNVLIVNGKTMSRNDFTIFADKALPGLCSPTPRISIHKKADFDIAAWVLDSFYLHGCMDVRID